jgi:hypothetical protein
MNSPTSISASTQVNDESSDASIASPERNTAWFPHQSTPPAQSQHLANNAAALPTLFVINPWQQQKSQINPSGSLGRALSSPKTQR